MRRVLPVLLLAAPLAASAQNLELDRVTAAPSGVAGGTLHVELDVLVEGIRAPFQWAAYLSPTGSLSGARALGSYGPARPTADGRMRVAADVALPADVGGSYFLVVELDPAHALLQSSTLDDALATDARSRVLAALPDPRVRGLRLVASSGRAGDPLAIDVELENAGTTDCDVELLAVLDPTPSVSVRDAELGRTTVHLAAGRAQVARLLGVVPAGLGVGAHYVGVIADPTGALEEGDEANNLALGAALFTVREDRLAVATESLPNGTVFQRYFAQLRAEGGDGDYRYAVSRGALPAGLTLDGARGIISGAPLASGPQSVTVEVRSAGLVAERELGFQIAPSGLELAVVTPELPQGTLGLEYTASLAAAGGEPPYRWTVLSGSLPSGLDFGTDGRLRGIPGDEGRFGLSVEVRDAVGGRVRAGFTLIIGPANIVILTTEPPAVMLGEEVNVELEVKGGQAPYEWIARSTPPPGLSLSEDGVLSGTPAKVGRFAMRVEVLDSRTRRRSDTAIVFVEVEDPGDFELEVPEIPPLALRQGLDLTLSVEGGKPPFTWRVDARDTIPSGFKLEPAALGEGTARLSGASVRAIDRAFLVEVSDKTGRVRSAIVALHVEGVSGAVAEGCACVKAPVGAPLGSLLLVGLALAPLARRRRRG